MHRKQQLICNFIVLFTLLLGVCTFETGADAVFVCKKAATLSTQLAEEGFAKADTSKSAEILCSSNIIPGSQTVAQHTYVRKLIRPLLILSGVAVCSLLLSKFYETERVTEFRGLLSRFVVLDFIYNTDGKK